MSHPIERFFHPALKASALRKKPRRVVIAGEAYVLFRDERGRPAALQDRCPHRFAPLSEGKVRPDGRLMCPYHGWRFDREGRGQSPAQPNLPCQVPALQVEERYGYLWLAAPGVSPESIPQYGWDGYMFAGAFSTRFPAPLHVCLDNFSEDEHTPFVHTRLGWEEDRAPEVEFEASNHDDRTEVHYRAPQRKARLLELLGVKENDIFHNDWKTYFNPVHSFYELYWKSPDRAETRPPRLRTPIYMIPEDERNTWFHVFVWASWNGQATMPSALLQRLLPPLAAFAVRVEVGDDARFIKKVANTPFDMKGMRLSRFDKPLVHNHKLLTRRYWGEES